jgi:phosphonate transport system substrate-binding protein
MWRILLVFLALTSQVSLAEDKSEIIFGFTPAENRDLVEAKGKLFSAWLEQRLGKKVRIFIANDYTALTEAMRSGHVNFGWFPPFSYIKAQQLAGAEALFKTNIKGRSVNYGAIIVRADRPYTTIADLNTKSIAWVDPSSSSGHIFPKSGIMQKHKVNPDKFFAKQVFAGSHDAVLLAVLNGTVDAGATFSLDEKGAEGSWNRYLKGDDAAKIKTIFVSEPFPIEIIATSKKFRMSHPQIVKKFRAAMEEMPKDSEGKKILKEQYKIDGFDRTQDSDLAPVRAAAKALKIN